jgi:hypothetical protein
VAFLPPVSRRNSTVTLVPAGVEVGKEQFGMSEMLGGQRESGHTIECQRHALSRPGQVPKTTTILKIET